MISLLAKEDLQDLRDAGLQPTDEDVIRLHALACRLTDGPETTAANAPRFALCGGLVFWEPTLAAWDWFKYAKTFAGDEEIGEWMFAFACLHGRERGFLEGLRDPAEIEKEVGKLVGTICATKKELQNAIYYVAIGEDDVTPEKTEIEKKKERDDPRIMRNYSRVEDILTKAAAATGLTYEDIMVQTPSRLSAMIYQACVIAGREMSSNEAKCHAEYLATLHAIRARLMEERDADSNQDSSSKS